MVSGRDFRSRLALTLKDIGRHIRDGQLPLVASSQAYISILSIIPLVALSFSIFQAFGGIERFYSFIEPIILSNLAEGSSEEVILTLRRFIGNIHGGALGAGGLVGVIITSMSLLSSAETAINRIWRAPHSRRWFHRIAAYWLFTTLGPLAAAILFGLVTSGRSGAFLARLPGGVTGFAFSTLLFFAIYKWVPNRKVHWQPALISGTLTSVLWNLAKDVYGLYTQEVLTNNKIYGSLAAVPVFLIWIYIVWLVILSGAAVTAALQKRFDFHDISTDRAPAPRTPG